MAERKDCGAILFFYYSNFCIWDSEAVPDYHQYCSMNAAFHLPMLHSPASPYCSVYCSAGEGV